jgi:23S rRNA (cytosine1962-C5)-methyltransferase
VKHLLVENLKPIEPEHRSKISGLVRVLNVDGIYEKRLAVNPRAAGDLSPKLFLGQPAPPRFIAQENGTKFELSFAEGYSIGLFLDQRENRRRLLTGHIAAGFSLFKPGQSPARPEVLNTFAYTCGFSVCAAKAGARVSSLDLSRKYLEWGKRNFLANQLDPAEHSFVFGDVFDWLKRFAKASRLFDVVLLDPPTFSRSKQFGVFRAQKDYGRLVRAALPLLKPGGVLFASSNAADWAPAAFLQTIRAAIQTANRSVMKEHYVPQPPDFPATRDEPAYLKTVWIRLS